MIDELEDPFIIRGYGRVGRHAAEVFVASARTFVVENLFAPGPRVGD